MQLTTKALIYATEKHKNDVRKTTNEPYIHHPVAVASILLNVKKSKNSDLLATCAYLHDVVEDTDATINDIRRDFGDDVADIVSQVTSDKDEINRIGKTLYLKNKMASMSSYALRLKLADRLHNLNSMVESKADSYITQTLEIINHITLNRKLTKTHMKLISDILLKINKLKNA